MDGLWLFRRVLPAGCLILALGCISPPAPDEPTDTTSTGNPPPQKAPKAQTCVAFADFDSRVARDPNRSPLDKEHLQDSARRAYQQAIKTDPHYLPAYIGLGRLYQELNETDRALATYKNGLAMLPRSAQLWYEQGVCQAQHQQWEPAAESFRNAVTQDPENRAYIKTLAFCLGRAGHYDESLASFRKVGNEAQAQYDLARLLHFMQQEQLSGDHLRLALAAQPGMPDATRLLAELTPIQKTPAQPMAATAPAAVHFEDAQPKGAPASDGDSIIRIGAHS